MNCQLCNKPITHGSASIPEGFCSNVCAAKPTGVPLPASQVAGLAADWKPSKGNPEHESDGQDELGHVWRCGHCLRCRSEMTEPEAAAECGPPGPRPARFCLPVVSVASGPTPIGIMNAVAGPGGVADGDFVAVKTPVLSEMTADGFMVVRVDDWTEMRALHTECRALVRAAGRGAIPGNLSTELAAVAKRMGMG